MLLNNLWIKQEVSKEIGGYCKLNENENILLQNLWNSNKVVLRVKCIILNAYIRKGKWFQANNPNFHLKKLEK